MKLRKFLIEHDGDEFHLSLFLGREKVGDLLMLDGGAGMAAGWCRELGRLWKTKGVKTVFPANGRQIAFD